MKQMTNDLFTLEMQILWENISSRKRKKLEKLIKQYYGKGDKMDKIIYKLQCKEAEKEPQ